MRDWCLVLDAVSPKEAKRIDRALRGSGFDLDLEASEARVRCFANSEVAIRRLSAEIKQKLVRESLWEGALQAEPAVRVWSEKHYRYVDPEHPEEDPDSGEVWIDSDLDPAEIRWRVRLKLASVFEFRRVRRQLPALRRPVIGAGSRHIDLGASDAGDAEDLVRAAQSLDGVASAAPAEIRGRLRRWRIRQRLAGNYAADLDGSGPGYGFDFGGTVSHPGGGGGGGHGGGGHGGGGGGHGG